MQAIWKFELIDIAGLQEVRMPEGAEILCFQAQNDRPCLLAKVNLPVFS